MFPLPFSPALPRRALGTPSTRSTYSYFLPHWRQNLAFRGFPVPHPAHGFPASPLPPPIVIFSALRTNEAMMQKITISKICSPFTPDSLRDPAPATRYTPPRFL